MTGAAGDPFASPVRYDLDALRGSVDLGEVCEELLGPGRGNGAHRRWTCPLPSHPGQQSGRTPPVHVMRATGSHPEKWWCSVCNQGGDVFDLLEHAEGLALPDAIRSLAARTGSTPTITGPRKARDDWPGLDAPRRVPASVPAPVSDAKTDEHLSQLDAYVETCVGNLWAPMGTAVRRYLMETRGLPEDVLRRARVGVDPGRQEMPRTDGLPSPQGVAVTFPALGDDGRAVYLQARPLDESRGKYLNPSRDFLSNPRHAVLPGAADTVVVTEGMPDALSVAAEGLSAFAVLGTGLPDLTLARLLVERFPAGDLVLAFDGDEAGRKGVEAFAPLLVEAGASGRVYALTVPESVSTEEKGRDLNSWRVKAGADFPAELQAALSARVAVGWEAAPPVPSAADRLPALVAEAERRRSVPAMSTGFPELDRHVAHGGWRPGLFLLSGSPGAGKTAFALQVSMTVAHGGVPVVFVSVEQSAEDLLGRVITRESSLRMEDYWNGTPAFVQAVHDSADQLPWHLLHLEGDPYVQGADTLGTVGRLRALVSRVAEQHGRAPFVVLDYLQRVRPPELDRRLDERQRISSTCLALRQTARDLGVPVLAVSSLGRTSYGRTEMDGLKGSGDLEYDADAVLMLHVPTEPEGDDLTPFGKPDGPLPIELHLTKNRYGALTGGAPLRLRYDRKHGRYDDDSLSGRTRRGAA